MNLDAILQAIASLLPGDVEKVAMAILKLLPVDSLLRLAESIATLTTAKTEEEQVKDAAQTIDASLDVLEDEATKP